METKDLYTWADEYNKSNDEPLLEGLWMIGSLSQRGYTLWGNIFKGYEQQK